MASVTLVGGDTNYLDPAFAAFNANDDITLDQHATLRITTPTSAGAGHIDRITAYGKLLVDGRGWKRIQVSGTSGVIAQGDVITVTRALENIGTCIYHEDVAGELGVRELTFALQAGDTLSTPGGYAATVDTDGVLRPMDVLIVSITASTGTDFEMIGGWMPLGTSDGSANQTFTYHSTGDLTMLRTGSGTDADPYIIWNNIQDCPFTEHTIPELSNVFQKDSGDTEVRFGDGTNGNIPPAGTVIYCHNTSFHKVDAAGNIIHDNVIQYIHTPSRFVLDTVNIARSFGMAGFLGLAADSRAVDTGFMTRFFINRIQETFTFLRCGWSQNLAIGNSGLFDSGFFNATIILQNCSLVSPQQATSNRHFGVNTGTRMEMYDTVSIAGRRNSTLNGSCIPQFGTVIAHRCTLAGVIGGENNSSTQGVELIDCRWAPTSGATNTFHGHHLQFESKAVIRNLQYIEGSAGSSATPEALFAGQVTLPYTKSVVANSGTRAVPIGKGHIGLDQLLNMNFQGELVFYNSHFELVDTGDQLNPGTGFAEMIMWNCSITSNRTLKTHSNLNVRSFKGIANTVGEGEIVHNTAEDTRNCIFMTTFPADSDTTGMLRLFGVAQTPDYPAYQIIQGTPEFRDHELNMFQDDIIEWTWPYPVLGYTGFAAAPLIRSNTTTTNTTGIDWTFDLSSGGGFTGEFLELTYGNLVKAPVDWEQGLQMKIRAHCTVASAKFVAMGIPMTTTAESQQILYIDPTSTPDIWRTLEWTVSAIPGAQTAFSATIGRDEGPYQFIVNLVDIPTTDIVDHAFMLVQPANLDINEFALDMTRVDGNTFQVITEPNQFDQFPPNTPLLFQIELEYRSQPIKGRGQPIANIALDASLRDNRPTSSGYT